MIVVSRQAESVLSGIADRKNPPSRRAAAQELLRLGPFVCHRRRRNAENKQSEQAGHPTRWNDILGGFVVITVIAALFTLASWR